MTNFFIVTKANTLLPTFNRSDDSQTFKQSKEMHIFLSKLLLLDIIIRYYMILGMYRIFASYSLRLRIVVWTVHLYSDE